ncbi:hypothetical protein [Amycolatopsis dongchuanensis]|uniref:Uncharacterized protein n=1 Tax=Amycolatopsis dongchuanensis TaxID=1070866 RepID=A0ABP9QXE3_9PSEU
MSDTAEYYKKLYRRATSLAQKLDKVILALVVANIDLQEIEKGDIGEQCEMGETYIADLKRCIGDAAFYTRFGEHINNAHLSDVTEELRNLGIDIRSIDPGPDRESKRTVDLNERGKP